MEEKSIWQKILKRYFINGLNGMALGLFCTLIVGLIIKQIGGIIGGNVGSFIISIGSVASICTGAVIGIGVAHTMSAPRLVVFSSAITGLIGANAASFVNGSLFNEAAAVVIDVNGNNI